MHLESIYLQREILLHIILQRNHQGRQSATKLFFSFPCQKEINCEKIRHDEYLIFDRFERQNLSRSKMHEHHNAYELQAIHLKSVEKHSHFGMSERNGGVRPGRSVRVKGVEV